MKPYYQRRNTTLYHSGALEAMRLMPENSIDSICCDPPGGINFMGLKFDSDRGGRNQWIAWLAEIMAEALRVTKPGGHGLVWALPRTAHWTGMALEDAGWEVRDKLSHIFGSGMKKGLDVSKAIDCMGGENVGWFGPWLREERARRGVTQKELARHFLSKTGGLTGCVANWELGLNVPTIEQFNTLCEVLELPFDRLEEVEREVIGKSKWSNSANHFIPGEDHTQRVNLDLTAPATEAAKQWEGFGSSLKPSVENWWLIRKPLSESSIARQVLATSTGALNVDASRVATDWSTDPTRRGWQGGNTAEDYDGATVPIGPAWRPGHQRVSKPNRLGRYPSHLLLSHVSPDENGEGGCVRVGERRVKSSQPATFRRSAAENDGNTSAAYGKENRREGHVTPGYGNSDGLETVEDWQCATDADGNFTAFSLDSGDFSPLSPPEYLLGQLGVLLPLVAAHSTTDSNLLRSACEPYRSAGRLSGASLADLACGVGRVLGLSKLPSFRACCPACLRLCGEHVRLLLEAAQSSPLQLSGALVRVHSDLCELVRSPQSRDSVLPISDDSAPLETPSRNPQSKTDAERQLPDPPGQERSACSAHMFSSELHVEERRNSTLASNRLESFGSCENLDRTLCSGAICRLLVCLSFDLATYILPSVIIQKSEIYINLPQCPIAELDRQSGVRPGDSLNRKPRRNTAEAHNRTNSMGRKSGDWTTEGHKDRGGASRYFVNFPPDTGPGFIYAPKASNADKNKGLEGLPKKSSGVMQDDSYTWEYDGKGNKINLNTTNQNHHPTVKSLQLMKYLVRMISPPGAMVLDCFAGSGSTGVAAIELGFGFIGVEMEEEYATICAARLDAANDKAAGVGTLFEELE